MMSQGKTQYPHHLARLVAERLRADHGRSPPETVLVRLLETLYFTSLKTEEGRRIVCTVTYIEPGAVDSIAASRQIPDQWMCVQFAGAMPLDVRTLSKLAQAADPTVSSLAVTSDAKHRLFICGMIDQEPRFTDTIFVDYLASAPWPGLFQATITGPGDVAVFCQGMLVGSLVQNALVEQYHNVLWSGPVHDVLAEDLRGALDQLAPRVASPGAKAGNENPPGNSATRALDHEILLRWLNCLGRILVGIQYYRSGGGVVIVPDGSLHGMNVRYRLKYDRLLPALVALVCEARSRNMLGDAADSSNLVRQIDKHKAELFGAIRFIAALARVDGIVALDRSLAVQGFGVELRSDSPLANVFAAGDALATEALLRRVDVASFGTRHRAVMRYCSEQAGSLGFVVSHDGDIQAISRIGPRLVFWENIDVQLALFQETRHNAGPDRAAVLRPLVSRPE
jgi:hypothetical protein